MHGPWIGISWPWMGLRLSRIMITVLKVIPIAGYDILAVLNFNCEFPDPRVKTSGRAIMATCRKCIKFHKIILCTMTVSGVKFKALLYCP